MARSRNIKPSFFTNDDLSDCSFAARLMFAGLWTLADRAGRLEDRPKKIRGELFPHDQIDADALLSELASKRFITRYSIGENKYIQVVNFEKHQNPHKNEIESVIPEPEPLAINPDLSGAAPEYSGLNPLTDSLTLGKKEPLSEVPKKNLGSRLPQDWRAEDDLRFFAASQGLTDREIALEEEKFRDYWHAVAGQKGSKADWPATWRNWIRNRRIENGTPQQKLTKSQRLDIALDKGLAAIEERERAAALAIEGPDPAVF